MGRKSRMKLWTQYQILVQFCSKACQLGTMEPWSWQLCRPELCFGVSFLPSPKNQAVPPMPIYCLGTHRDVALPFSSQRPLPWQLLSPLPSPCHSSSLLAGVSWQGPREKRRQRVCGAGWCPSQGCWVVLQEEVGRGHCWRAAALQCTHPLRCESRGHSAVHAQEKGKRNGKWMLQCLLSSYFLNWSWWVWLDIFVNT